MAKPGCRCITWPTHFLRAAGRTPSFLQREGRCCRQGFLWQRRDREKGEVHSDPMFPGWLAALLLHHLLASAAYDAGGVPPEQLLPLHAKACQGQGRSSTGHDTPHTVMRTPLHTAVMDSHVTASHGNARWDDKPGDKEGCVPCFWELGIHP